MKIYFSWFS